MKQRISFFLMMVIGGLVALGPQTLFKVCEVTEDHIMKCHWTAQAELGLGTALAIIALIGILSNNNIFQKGLHVGAVILGGLIIAIPTVLIGVCDNAMMHCRMLTLPILVVLGVMTIVIGLFNIFTTKEK